MNEHLLTKIIQTVKNDTDVLALMLFGSKARGDDQASSGIDLCLFPD